MWQSQVEIQHCSVPYFNHVTAFKAVVQTVLLRGGEGRGEGGGGGGAYIRSIDAHV